MTEPAEPLSHSPTDPLARRIRQWTVVLILVGLTWRTVRFALAFPLWGDESFVAVNLLLRDFRGMLRPLAYDEFVPVLFMWMELSVGRLLGFSEHALRFGPYVCGIAGVLLFWRFCRNTTNELAAMLATGILAVSYYPVRHAIEVKPYAGDLLATVVLFNLAWDLHRRPESRIRWLLLWLAAVLAVWWSYPACFAAGGVAVFLLIELRQRFSWKAATKVGLYALLLGASFLFMYFSYARPQRHVGGWITEVATWQPSFPPVEQPWRIPGWLLGIHTGNMLAYPVGGKGGGSVLTFILALIGIAAAWRESRPLLACFGACLGANLVAAGMHAYPYGNSARVSLYAAPIFCWLAGRGLAAILSRRLAAHPGSRIVGIVAMILLLLGVGGMVRDVVQPYKGRGDVECRRVLRELAQQTGPADRWVVFNAERNCKYAPFIGESGGTGARFRYYVRTLSPVPVEWGPPPETVASVGPGRTWLLAHERGEHAYERRLSAYIQKLARQLGQPESKLYRIADDERISIVRFDPKPATRAEEVNRQGAKNAR